MIFDKTIKPKEEAFYTPLPLSKHEVFGYWVESDQAMLMLEQHQLPIPRGYKFLNSERVQLSA